jgi:uncharacterized membrane protein
VNEIDKKSSPNREDRIMAALAYPFWFVVFPLIYMTPDKRNDPFLRFHSYQGAFLGMFGFVGLSLLRALLCTVFRWFILFDVLLYPLLKAAEYGLLALVAYGALYAFLGKYAKIPYVSGFVKSLNETPGEATETGEQ